MVNAADRRARPLLITLSGPEGTGKTTNREFLLQLLKDSGITARGFHTSRLAFSSLIMRCLEVIGLRKKTSRTYEVPVEKVNSATENSDQSSNDRCVRIDSGRKELQSDQESPAAVHSLRQRLRNLRRCLGYVVDAFILRWMLVQQYRSGTQAVVCDRYIYDAMSRIVEKHPRWAKLISKIAPHSDLAFVLSGDPMELCIRRPGSTVEYHRRRLQQFDALRRQYRELIVIDPTDLIHVQLLIRQHVDQLLLHR